MTVASTATSVVRIPLLFWKPGLATVPLLDVSLAPEGGGAVHASIRRPFETLDQTTPPLDRLLLPALLPRFARLDHYTCAYHLPPHDVDQFIEEFPRGLSHLLSVSLAFYALGADHALGGSAFREALSRWTATGYPDKSGRIRGVTGLREKLDALCEEQVELEQAGGPRVDGVLVSDENRSDVDAIAKPAEVPVEWNLACRGGRSIRLVVVGTFADALDRVFGKALLDRYERRNVASRVRRSPWTWTAGATVLVLALGLTGLHLRRTRDVAAVRAGASGTPGVDESIDIRRDPLAGSKVVVSYADAGEEWIGPLDGSVTVPVVERDGQGRATAIVVGLQRPGPAAGSVVRLERDWLGSWQVLRVTDPWRELVGAGADDVPRGVRFVRCAELLAENEGPETLACVVSDAGPCLLAILNAQGDVLRSLWHDGTIEGVETLSNPTRILGWACANSLPSWGDDVDPWFRTQDARDAADPYALGPQGPHDRVLFCIPPGRLSGRSPCGGAAVPQKIGDGATPTAKFDYYRRFTPKGFRLNTIDLQFPRQEGADVVLSVTGYRLHVAADGRIVARQRGAAGRGIPEPDLESVVDR